MEAASSSWPSREHRGEKHRQGSDPFFDRIAGGRRTKSYSHKGESTASLLHRQTQRGQNSCRGYTSGCGRLNRAKKEEEEGEQATHSV